MKVLKKGTGVVTLCLLCLLIGGCSRIREIADSYEAPTEPIKVTNEDRYTVVRSESEIESMFLETMRSNKTTCYFNVSDEAMVVPDIWAKAFDGINSVQAEYTIAQNGFNVVVTLAYWDAYPIVAAFENNDTTILSATQLELFDKYCDILGSCTSKSYTDYENELAIHDYLVSNIEYDAQADTTTTAYDALVKGKANCGGYQESFKTLLDMLGIENMAVNGTGNDGNHAWNLVKLDGIWYHVDVTWDDPIGGDGTISHKYFNVSDADMALDHIWDEDNYPKATGGAYAYYMMSGMAQIHNRQELDDFIQEKVSNKSEKIEFLYYGEALDGDALYEVLNKTDVGMSATFNYLQKTEFIVYDISITYN